MKPKEHDLVVVGAGPGGYVAAIRAAQLGWNVACVEKETALGGTCLRVGCIPSKALLESSERFQEARKSLAAHGVRVGEATLDLDTLLQRKDAIVSGLTRGVEALFKKNKITRYKGQGRLTGEGEVTVESDGKPVALRARHILIATGSQPARIRQVELDGDRIGTSTEALGYPEVPGHLVVIGAGYIGLELGSVWSRLGARVTVVEALDRILPGMDAELSRDAQRLLTRQGLEFRLETKVRSARRDKQGCRVELDGAEPIECDRVLLAVGRVPNTRGLGLDDLGVKQDDQGRVVVDRRFATNVKGVYAIGDVIGGPMLAHKAEEEGVAFAEQRVRGHGEVNYDAIPSVVYTHPEFASVGRTESQLREAGTEFRKGVFPFRANGRAQTLGDAEGKVKVLADRGTDRVLGIHILGPRAGEVIAEAATAMSFGASSEDIARTCHAHPSLSEALREAALGVQGRALHV